MVSFTARRLALPPRGLAGAGLARLLITVASVAATAGSAYTFVLLPLEGHFGGWFEDFAAYMQGMTALVHGSSPYAPFSSATPVMGGFDYPPFAALFLRPFTMLGEQWQMVAWLFLSLAALILGSVITARSLLPAGWPRTRIALVVALTFPAATYNLWHGQVNTFIFLLLALALREWQRDRLVRFGLIIGVAAAIKLAPAVLLLLLVRRGEWRALAAAVATVAGSVGLGVLAFGADVTRQYVGQVMPVLTRDNGWIFNDTWNGAVNRVLEHSVLTVQPPSAVARVLTLLLILSTVAVLLAVSGRRQMTRAEADAEFGVAVCAMVLVGSIAWYPLSVHLLIPLAAAVALGWERRLQKTGGRRRQARRLWAVAAAALAGISGIGWVLSATVISASMYSGAIGWLKLQLMSLPVVLNATLMLTIAATLGLQARGLLPQRRAAALHRARATAVRGGPAGS